MSASFMIPTSIFANNKFLLKAEESQVTAGSIIFVAGPNGSGKSTLLKGLSNLLTPLVPAPALYLSSQFHPQEGLTGNDLFDLFEVQNSPYFNPLLLKDFKIDHLLHVKLENLSSGERQKFFLCAALFNKNSTITLDEPLNFLDVSFYPVLRKALLEYSLEGRTFFISNHDFNWSLTFPKSQTWVVFKNQIFLRGLTTKVLSDIKLKEAFGVSFKTLDLEGNKYIFVD